MRTGLTGWHKRTNRSFKEVSRSCQINDDVVIDASRDAIGKMHAAAKSMVLKRKTNIAADLGSIGNILPASSSGTADSLSVTFLAMQKNKSLEQGTGLLNFFFKEIKV